MRTPRTATINSADTAIAIRNMFCVRLVRVNNGNMREIRLNGFEMGLGGIQLFQIVSRVFALGVSATPKVAENEAPPSSAAIPE